MLKNTPQQWGLISQALHWGIALLMVLVIALGLIGHELPLSGEKIKIFVYHKSVGILILAIVLIRIGWKLSQPQPDAAQGINSQQHKMANLGHLGLYMLMLALPLSGWLLNSAAGFPFKWMDLFAFPNIPGVGEPQKDFFIDAHHLLFRVLVVVLIGHIGMALFHHFKHNNNVLTRMLPNSHKGLWWGLLVFYIALSVFILMQTFSQKTGETSAAIGGVGATDVPLIEGELEDRTEQQWAVITEQSTLGFSNNYDGIEFDGEFSTFNAELFFDASAIDTGFFDVTIDTASVTTFNPDWDSSLPDEEWFNILQFPEAHYRASAFIKEGDKYIAQGQLTLKGFSRAVPLRFTWVERDDGKVNFNGTATVKRTDFGIGSGLWQDDATIGFDVEVKVVLLLDRSE